jgi:hypothetical protein
MRLLTAGAVVAGAFIAAAAPLGAQSCVGYAPFANGTLRLAGDLALADNATTFGASAVFGAAQPGLFGGGSISGTRFDHIDDTQKTLGLSGGFSIPLVSMRGTELCPLADYAHSWGPGDNFSGNSIALGGAIGHPFAASPTVMLVPFADLRWVHASGTIADTPVGDIKTSDNFGSLTLGSGIMFTSTVTLRPAVAIPIARDGASSVFLVSIAFNLGK